MKSTNWEFVCNKIKKWYEKLSGTSKFVIFLTVLLVVSNIVINIWSSRTYQEVEHTIDNIINDSVNETFLWAEFAGGFEIINKLLEILKYLFFVLVSIIAYYISLCVGKALGLFKSIAEFLGNIKEDGCLIVVLAIYDIVGLAFDLYSIYALVTV